MDGRLVADRNGFLGRSRNRERLTTATAPIDLTAIAASARLAHPFGAAKRIEGRRILPDLRKALLFHVPEFKARYGFGRMTGQHPARRCHVERLASPYAH